MTPETVIASYRDRSGDNDKNRVIISDDEGVRYINDGIKALMTDHPECTLNAAGALIAYSAANKNQMGTDLILSDAYFEPLVDYVCYRRYIKDSGDAKDENRAAEHLAKLNAFWAGEK